MGQSAESEQRRLAGVLGQPSSPSAPLLPDGGKTFRTGQPSLADQREIEIEPKLL
jgi:hypothetical protein